MTILETIAAQPKLESILTKIHATTFDIIIIGGGPAGLTAGIYGGRLGLKTLIVEKAILGGLASTAYRIENYPGFPEGISGMDLSSKLEEQARKYGVQIVYGTAGAIEIDKKNKVLHVDNRKFHTKTIILATGTLPKKLNVPGEENLRGRGISYCATCDGPFYREKNIIVAGGGNSAIGEAIFLTRFAKKVSIVHRRDKLRADLVLAHQAASNPKIFIIWNSMICEIRGKERVEEVVLKNALTENISVIQADGVFIYVGSIPQTEFLRGFVNLDENGFIVTTGRLTTSQPGIFVAGDVREKTLRQVVTAASDGAIAADEARKYIEDNK